MNALRWLLKWLAKPIIQEGVMLVSLVVLFADYNWYHELQERGYWVAWLRLSLRVFYAYLATWLVVIVNRRWFKLMIYTLATLLFVVESFLQLRFHMDVGPAMFRLIAETNPQESREFITNFVMARPTIKVFALAAVVVGCIAIAERYRHTLAQWIQRIRLQPVLLSVMAVMVGCGAWASLSFVDLFSYHTTERANRWCDLDPVAPNDVVSSLIFALHDFDISNQETSRSVQSNILASQEQATLLHPNDSVTLVVVIGESFNKHHSSLYGYPLPTNPRLALERDRGNLMVFSDVVSPFNKTSTVLKEVMTTSNLADGITWDQSPMFSTIFKRAGYQVWLWDNQRHDSPLATFAFTLNAFLYNPQIMRLAYDKLNEQSFVLDSELVQDFEQHAQDHLTGRNLVILHLMGQHFDARERYPHKRLDFNHFTANEVPQQAIALSEDARTHIANYDTATAFNDLVMKMIFDLFSNHNAVVVYFADHGEEVYDWRDFISRTDNMRINAQEAKYQYEVPFVIWCSDRYISQHPQEVAQMQQATSQPLMLDQVCQLLFHLGGIQSPYYQAQHDPLSATFKPSKRILNYVVDYDSLMSQRDSLRIK